MPKPTIECSNCNQCFEAHYPYCPYCGHLFISVVFFFLFSFISREQTQSMDGAMKDNSTKINVVIDSLQQRRSDSIVAQRFLNPLRKNQKQFGLKDEEISQADSIINVGSGPNGSIFGINFKGAEIDSMIASGTSDQKIYEHLGMKEDDGIFTKRIYRQGLKFYKTKSEVLYYKHFMIVFRLQCSYCCQFLD